MIKKQVLVQICKQDIHSIKTARVLTVCGLLLLVPNLTVILQLSQLTIVVRAHFMQCQLGSPDWQG